MILNIGVRFKEIRNKLNLSQKVLAASIGMSQSKLCKIETGVLKPDVFETMHFCKFAGISIYDLLGTEYIDAPLLTKYQRELLNKIVKLNDRQILKLIDFIDSILAD